MRERMIGRIADVREERKTGRQQAEHRQR